MHTARPPSSGSPRKEHFSRPQSACSTAGSIGKRQRAIYSEVLIPDDANVPGRNLAGPSTARDFRQGREQRPLSANGFSQKRWAGPGVAKEPETRHAKVAPKVCEAYKTLPGRAPRRVRIERLRRQYESHDIQRLLLDRDINLTDAGFDQQSPLPIHPFDDSEYDVRSPFEWIKMGIDTETGQFKPLSAQALSCNPETGLSSWRNALVNHYDEKAQRFEVTFVGGMERNGTEPGLRHNETVMLPRLAILFDAEDPEVFADRAAAAMASRKIAEIQIKYNFFIDNMPTEDVQQLNSDQIDWLKDTTKTALHLGANGLKEVDAVLAEVQLEFARAMNRVTFDMHMLRQSEGDYLNSKELIDASLMGPVAKAILPRGALEGRRLSPLKGLVAIPPHPFTENFAALCFATLRVRPEVILALQGIKAACLERLGNEHIFSLDFTKSLHLDEFRQAQKSVAANASFALKEAWPQELKQIVLRELGSVGKGWFNLEDKGSDLFRAGKLRKFMILVRLIMQNTLRSMAKTCAQDFVRASESLSPIIIRVDSLAGASCNYRAGVLIQPKPAFCVEVRPMETSEDGFALSTDPDRFLQAALDCFDAGLQILNEVSPLERIVIPGLSRLQSDIPARIEAFSFEEQWVQDARERIKKCLGNACSAPKDYLKLFENFDGQELYAREPAAWVEEYFQIVGGIGGEPCNEEVQEAILLEQASEEDLLLTLPDAADIGLFRIICKDVRRTLASKHNTTATLMLERLVQRLRNQMEDSLSSFQSLIAGIARAPKGVEELVEMRKQVATAPRQINSMKEGLAIHMRLHEQLEGFLHKFSVEDMRLRWKLVASPKEAMDEVKRKLRSLQFFEGEFIRQLKNQQDEFVGNLADIAQTIELFQRNPEYWDVKVVTQIAEAADSVRERLAKSATEAVEINKKEELLGRQPTDYSGLNDITTMFEPYGSLWSTVQIWYAKRDIWRRGDLKAVDAEALEKEAYKGCTALQHVCQTFRTTQCPEAVLAIAETTYSELLAFRPCVPLVVALRTEGMETRHWEEISREVGTPVNPDMVEFNLHDLCKPPFELQNHTEFLQLMASKASKEFAIKLRLQEMKGAWTGLAFDCHEQFGNSGTFVLAGIEPVSVLLDEQLVVTQALLHSPFKGRLASEIDEWAQLLRYMLDHLEAWRRCQTNWQYLQPIFDSLDVTRALPSESRRFKAVDSLWRSIMQATREESLAFNCLSKELLLERWTESSQRLESVRRSLDEYLEQKRDKFSRLYTLSGHELLQVISKARDPVQIQPLLCRLFPGLSRLVLKGPMISSVISPFEEELLLHEAVNVQEDNVEVWLAELELALYGAVRSAVRDAVVACQPDQTRWMTDHPAQAVLCAIQVRWGIEVESSLRHEDIEDASASIPQQLNQMSAQLRQRLADSGKLLAEASGHRQRVLHEGVVLLQVQQRDLVAALAEHAVCDPSDFEWVSQIRLCWEAVSDIDTLGDLWVRCLRTGMPYGYEYLSLAPRLVATPGTLRCQACLLELHWLGKGAAVTSAGGNGKSETLLDLAQTVGRHCVSISFRYCTDPALITQLLKGAAGTGSWCCLDELGAAKVELLAVLTQQLFQLFSARDSLLQNGSWAPSERAVLKIDGSTAYVKASFHAIGAFNSSGNSLSSLSPSLLALLRPVALHPVDIAKVIETRLFMAGFIDFKNLAYKLKLAFRLFQDQLACSMPRSGDGFVGSISSPRTILATVDIMCRYRRDAIGMVAKAEEKINSSKKALPRRLRTQPALCHARQKGSADIKGSRRRETTATDQMDAPRKELTKEDEQNYLVQALQDRIQPGLLQVSMPMFKDILEDILSAGSTAGVKSSEQDRTFISQRIGQACDALGFQFSELLIDKVAQLQGAIKSYNGVMLIGPPGCGKTSSRTVLQRILSSRQGEDVQAYAVSPATEMGRLLGGFDEDSHEWHDSAFILFARGAMSNAEKGGEHWLMLDGPVAAAWADQLCPSLDERHLLCLSSGEVIRLPKNVTTIFEAEDLHAASPASVCRCGVVSFERHHLRAQMIITSWLEDLPHVLKKLKLRMQGILNDLVLPTIAFTVSTAADIYEGFIPAAMEPLEQIRLPATEVSLCKSFIGICSSLVEAFSGDLNRHLEQVVLFAVMLSVGAVFFEAGRPSFAEQLYEICSAADITWPEISSPRQLFDKAFDLHRGAWMDWEVWLKTSKKGNTESEQQILFHEFFVPSIESMRGCSILELTLPFGRHAALLGPSSAGKSAMIRHRLEQWTRNQSIIPAKNSIGDHQGLALPPTYARVVLSTRTESSSLQLAMESRLDKRRRGIYGPCLTKSGRSVFFIDDLHMPRRHSYYGAQAPLELLRQWFDHGGWFRSDEQSFCQVVDIAMAAALRPTVMTEEALPLRLLRHYHCAALASPSEDSAIVILSALLDNFSSIQGSALLPSNVLASISMATLRSLKQSLPPVPQRAHCCFDFSDLWKVARGFSEIRKCEDIQKNYVARAWYHEHLRVMGDRLGSIEEQRLLETCLNEICEQKLGVYAEAVFSGLPLIFTEVGPDLLSDVRGAREVHDLGVVQTWLQEQLLEIRKPLLPKPLVLSQTFCLHVVRLVRALRHPGSHCLLLGLPGSGRQTLARFVAALLDHGCREGATFSSRPASSHGNNKWRSYLRSCMLEAASSEGKPQMMLLNELQHLDDTSLGDMSRLLDGGEISELFAVAEDIKALVQSVTTCCAELRLEPTHANALVVFAKRVSSRLHCVLMLNPISQVFRQRLRTFPGLRRCSIQWIHEWPDEALLDAVGAFFPEEVSEPGQGSPQLDPAVQSLIIKAMPDFHKSAAQMLETATRGQYQVASSSIFKFVELFHDMFIRCAGYATQRQEMLDRAVQKLEDTKAHFQQLHMDQKNQWPQFEKLKDAVDTQDKEVQVQRARQISAARQVEKQEERMNEKRHELEKFEEQVNSGLADANAAIDAALESVKRVTTAQVREVRNTGKPQPSVAMSMACLCIMLSVPPQRKLGSTSSSVDDYWQAAQAQLLKDPKRLLDEIVGLEKDYLIEDNLKKVASYLDREELDISALRKQSPFCEAVMLWIRSLVKYNKSQDKVREPRTKIKEVNLDISRLEELLKTSRQKAADAQEHVKEAEARLQELAQRHEDFIMESSNTEGKISRAKQLLSALSTQKSGWVSKAASLNSALSLLPGDLVMSAAHAVYLGCLDEAGRSSFRKTALILLQALEIPHTEGAVNILATTYVDPLKIQDWHLLGLPKDPFMVENAIIADTVLQWPFMVDPHNQGVQFVKSLPDKDNDAKDDGKRGLVRAVRASDPRFLSKVSAAVEMGECLLIEEVSWQLLDLALLSVLQGRRASAAQGLTSAGSQEGNASVSELEVTVDGKRLAWHSSFRLFLATSAAKPDLPPELLLHLTPIYFAVTTCLLEEQMLSLVAASQDPGLEKRRLETTLLRVKQQHAVDAMENQVLKLLDAVEGDLLDDETLASSVLAARKLWASAEESLTGSRKDEKHIDGRRQEGKYLARQMAAIAAVALRIESWSSFYRLSLQMLADIMARVLKAQSSLLDDVEDEAINYAGQQCCRAFYEELVGLLYDEHRLSFGFHLVTARLSSLRREEAEIKFLLSAASGYVDIGTISSTAAARQAAELLPESMRDGFLALVRVPSFSGLPASLVSAEEQWRTFRQKSAHPEEDAVPGNSMRNITPLQRVCLLHVLRPDSVPRAVAALVQEEVCAELPSEPSLEALIRASSRLAPILFLPTPEGPDPATEVASLASKANVQLKMSSLASGHTSRAFDLVQVSANSGDWVVLCDCHLAQAWLSELDRLLGSFDLETTHSTFRLFLTTNEADSMPGMLVRECVKINLCSPIGIRARLLTSLSSASNRIKEEVQEEQKKINPSQRKAEEHRRQLDFGLCLLHSLSAVRAKRFGKLGWGVPSHLFSAEALRLARLQLGRVFDQPGFDAAACCWIAESHFGAGLEGAQDQYLLQLYIERYFLGNAEPGSPGHNFCSCFQPGCSKEELLDAVGLLPVRAEPQAFGFHQFAELSEDQAVARELIASLKWTSDDAMHGLISPEDVTSMGTRLPDPIDEDRLLENWPQMYEQPLNGSLSQEVSCLNAVICRVGSDLMELQFALQGLSELRESLEHFAESLHKKVVPAAWLQSSCSEKKNLSSWMRELEARTTFFNNWVWQENIGTELHAGPESYWLGGFVFPKAFLVCIQQRYSRRNAVALGLVIFQHHVVSSAAEAKSQTETGENAKQLKKKKTQDATSAIWNAENNDGETEMSRQTSKSGKGRKRNSGGVLVSGLVLHGCSWDLGRNVLVPCSDGERFCTLPLVMFTAARASLEPKNHASAKLYYSAAVYRAATRDSLVTSVNLPCTENSEALWALAGVAVLLSRPDEEVY